MLFHKIYTPEFLTDPTSYQYSYQDLTLDTRLDATLAVKAISEDLETENDSEKMMRFEFSIYHDHVST